jgi:hypothetical protein
MYAESDNKPAARITRCVANSVNPSVNQEMLPSGILGDACSTPLPTHSCMSSCAKSSSTWSSMRRVESMSATKAFANRCPPILPRGATPIDTR